MVFGVSFATNARFILKNPDFLRFAPFKEWAARNENVHLGAEHYFIATAIVSGKGFSNPFQADTGPTAWMPPVYPLLLAGLIKILNSHRLVMFVVLIAKNLVLVLTGLSIYNVAKDTLRNIPPLLTLFIYILWLFSFFYWFFQITHDIWLVLLCVNIVYILALKLSSPGSKPFLFYIFGVTGGISSLVNPALVPVWLAILVYILLKKGRAFLVPAISAVLIFAAVNSLWCVRNLTVFDKLIFVKSNLYFDAYLSNYVKDDGIPNQGFFMKHPVWTTRSDPRSDYRRLGEEKYCESFKRKFIEELRHSPGIFMQKVQNRLLAALLIYYPYNKKIEAGVMPLKYVIHALPFLMLILTLILKKKIPHYLAPAVLTYFIFLSPYILISYYIRYSLPLTMIQVMFIAWGLDSLYGAIRRINH